MEEAAAVAQDVLDSLPVRAGTTSTRSGDWREQLNYTLVGGWRRPEMHELLTSRDGVPEMLPLLRAVLRGVAVEAEFDSSLQELLQEEEGEEEGSEAGVWPEDSTREGGEAAVSSLAGSAVHDLEGNDWLAAVPKEALAAAEAAAAASVAATADHITSRPPRVLMATMGVAAPMESSASASATTLKKIVRGPKGWNACPSLRWSPFLDSSPAPRPSCFHVPAPPPPGFGSTAPRASLVASNGCRPNVNNPVARSSTSMLAPAASAAAESLAWHEHGSSSCSMAERRPFATDPHGLPLVSSSNQDRVGSKRSWRSQGAATDYVSAAIGTRDGSGVGIAPAVLGMSLAGTSMQPPDTGMHAAPAPRRMRTG